MIPTYNPFCYHQAPLARQASIVSAPPCIPSTPLPDHNESMTPTYKPSCYHQGPLTRQTSVVSVPPCIPPIPSPDHNDSMIPTYKPSFYHQAPLSRQNMCCLSSSLRSVNLSTCWLRSWLVACSVASWSSKPRCIWIASSRAAFTSESLSTNACKWERLFIWKDKSMVRIYDVSSAAYYYLFHLNWKPISWDIVIFVNQSIFYFCLSSESQC